MTHQNSDEVWSWSFQKSSSCHRQGWNEGVLPRQWEEEWLDAVEQGWKITGGKKVEQDRVNSNIKVQNTNAPAITVCVVQLHQQSSPKRYHKTQLEDPPNLSALCSMPYDKRGNVNLQSQKQLIKFWWYWPQVSITPRFYEQLLRWFPFDACCLGL